MSSRYTFAMIKPDAIKSGYMGEILCMILNDGFNIKAIKKTALSLSEAQKFYKDHIGKDFFEPLTHFISSGPLVAMVLEKPEAVNDFRNLIGSTDPAKAGQGTIRERFGTTTTFNAVHGADTPEHALKEWRFFFSEREVF